jgi:hypothetical protein
VHHRGFQRDGSIERRQQARQSLRQHGLARAGWPHQQQVMTTRSRHLQCGSRCGLAAHVGKVGQGHDVVDEIVVGRFRPGSLGVQGIHQLPQRARNAHGIASHSLCLTGAGAGHHGPHTTTQGRHHGGHTGHTAQAAVEADFAQEPEPVDGVWMHLLAGSQQTYRNRKVETRAALALAGRRQVHRDPTRWPHQATGQHRCAHTISRFAARFVGQPDDLERRQPGGHVDLHCDGAPFDAEQRGRTNGSQHADLLQRRWRARRQ